MKTLASTLETESIAITSTGIWTKEGETITFHPTCGRSYTATGVDTLETINAVRGAFKSYVLTRLKDR